MLTNRADSVRRAVGERLGCGTSFNASRMARDVNPRLPDRSLASRKTADGATRGETEEIYEDLDLLESVANNIANVDTMTWNTICVFGIAVSWPAVSYMRKFRPEFEACIRESKLVEDSYPSG